MYKMILHLTSNLTWKFIYYFVWCMLNRICFVMIDNHKDKTNIEENRLLSFGFISFVAKSMKVGADNMSGFEMLQIVFNTFKKLKYLKI